MATTTIGTTAIFLCQPNRDEVLDVLIVNNSANIVYVGIDSDVTSDNGIPLPANGGSYSSPAEGRFDPVWLIASAANSDVRYDYQRRKSREH